ncbi:hypothetical protein [Desulfogranum mediterraneum]|uniref:hypothetical protein n=1 Tax=Desulfogranum mediterraneum TaxID=160661 RepID=UPI00040D9218|nr:hypothetical protein [Desulfogranum mediterraneum]
MNILTGFNLRYGLAILVLCSLSPSWAWGVENAECLECHSDESLTKESTDNILNTEITESLYVDEESFNHSIHNDNGIACVDCHADIEELNWDEELPHAATLESVCCCSCHEESAEEFKDSVHMEIRKKGVTMTCYACHGYHDVKPMEAALVSERANSVCLKCHNPAHTHDWLPAADSHFAFVECVVCHAPEVPRTINLRFYDLVTNQFLSGDQLLDTLGIEYDAFMTTVDTNGNQQIDTDEFDDLILMLKQKDVHAALRAELVAEINPLAHNIRSGSAQKDCGNCHAADSPYFNTVSILLTNADGSIERCTIDRSVLQSYYVNHFYLLGGTRVKLLDKIGLLILAGGACGAGLHLLGRILTSPIRRKKSKK